jgi:hypothetical protein
MATLAVAAQRAAPSKDDIGGPFQTRLVKVYNLPIIAVLSLVDFGRRFL